MRILIAYLCALCAAAQTSVFRLPGAWASPAAPLAVNAGGTGARDASSARANLGLSTFVDSSASYSNPAWLTALAYAKLTGAPLIPSAVSQLSNDSGFLTSASSLAWAKLSGVPSTFTPSAHTHAWGDITSGVPAFANTASSYTDPSWLTLTKAKVGLSSVENTALSTWAGSANITTLGTIASGSVPWARVTSAPTFADTAGSYTDPSWLTLTSAKVGLGSVENTALSTWAGTANITTAKATTFTSTSLGGVTVSNNVDNIGFVAHSTNTGGHTWGIWSTGGSSGAGQGALGFNDETMSYAWRFVLPADGGAQIMSASLPTCNSAHAGVFFYVQGNASTKDTVQVCAHDATNTYAWRTIY